MMELIEVLQKISQDAAGGMGLTDLTIGTVTSASPLEITTQTSMQVLKSPVLYLTSAVVEKTLSPLTHLHSYGSGLTTENALESVVCTENGQALPSDSTGITLNQSLQVGDKVLLLRVQRGQKFVVLSRVYGGDSA